MPKMLRHWTTPALLPVCGCRLTPSPLYQPDIHLSDMEQGHRSLHSLKPASLIVTQTLYCPYSAVYPKLIGVHGKKLHVVLPYPVASRKRNKNSLHILLPHYFLPAVSIPPVDLRYLLP